MKKPWFRLLSCVVGLILVFGGCSVPKKAPTLDVETEGLLAEPMYVYSLDPSDTSPLVHLTQETASSLIRSVQNTKVTYAYADLYELNTCFERFENMPRITTHSGCATDANGRLSPEHLREIVKQNNDKYLALNDFLLQSPNDDDLLDICTLIVAVIDELYVRYPFIDGERVSCNLADLKILFKGGMLNLAEVTADRVLHISENSQTMAQVLFHDNAYRNTLIHETVHIVQIGCPCENTEHLRRRCGVAYSWSDFPMNTTDNTWLAEGSAEHLSALLSGDRPITYKYMIDYINTINMVTMLQCDTPAYYTEAISFFEDIEVLFELFGCETRADREEVLSMLISVNWIQMQPNALLERYDAVYNADTAENEEAMYEVFYRLKPAVCLTFAKQFYRNLVQLVCEEKSVTVNDVCFMIRLTESAFNGHMMLDDTDKAVYNQEFLDVYVPLRDSFFAAVENDCGIDLAAYYKDYAVFDNEEDTSVQASLRWLDVSKTGVYWERLERLNENATGIYAVSFHT